MRARHVGRMRYLSSRKLTGKVPKLTLPSGGILHYILTLHCAWSRRRIQERCRKELALRVRNIFHLPSITVEIHVGNPSPPHTQTQTQKHMQKRTDAHGGGACTHAHTHVQTKIASAVFFTRSSSAYRYRKMPLKAMPREQVVPAGLHGWCLGGHWHAFRTLTLTLTFRWYSVLSLLFLFTWR